MNVQQAYEAELAAKGFSSDPAQMRAIAALERCAQEWGAYKKRRSNALKKLLNRPDIPRGVYMYGGVGRGKSMLMDLFTENTAISGKRRVHFHAFMQEIHHGMHAARKRGVDDALAPVAADVAGKLRLLAFDEMQITDITDAMIVGRLFQMLMDQGVVIVTTSNRPPEDLYKNGLNRALFLPFIDLLRARLNVHELESPNDYRQHRLEGAQVYFHPAGKSGPQIEAIWSDLTGGARGEVLRLPVNGRETEVPRFANGVGRATFWELCARPLGPADYLAIAEAVRVLILEDIPQLSASNYNEAKRFVTLIDALYDGKASQFIETEVKFEDGRRGKVSADLVIRDCKTFPIVRKAA